jgi:hypothetical protein
MVRRLLAAVVGFVAVGSFVPMPVDAKSKVRTEKAFGVCLTVPTTLFPKPGKTGVTERYVDDGSGSGSSVTEPDFRVTGRKDREVIVWVSSTYREPKLGWAIPVDTQYITRTADGYRAKGVWDPEKESPGGGPWYGRTYRLDNGGAILVEMYLASGDDRAFKTEVAAMVASVRRC